MRTGSGAYLVVQCGSWWNVGWLLVGVMVGGGVCGWREVVVWKALVVGEEGSREGVVVGEGWL